MKEEEEEEEEEEEASFDLLDPNPDILALFCHYNDIYFQNKLHTCTVAWSSSRMTLCAGICKYTNGSCEIRLSEPLLKFRSSAELKETLLHEMIHAYLWLTDSNKDHEDHGPCFQKMMQAINDSQILDHQRPERGYHISIYHQFSEEVNSYRKHHWKCTRCGDLIKRAQNRAPSQADCYQKFGRGHGCSNEHCHWHNHQQHCGGDYEKIAEPEGYKDRRPNYCRYERESAPEHKAFGEGKGKFVKKKDAVGNMRRDKIKNREDNMSGRMEKGASLEMYFSTNSNGAGEKVLTTTKFGELCGETLNEKETVGRMAKKRSRDCKDDETDESDFYLTVDGAKGLGRAAVQNDKCTVIIGWKGWCAFESEEDEKTMKALDNKRSQRRMFERAHCQVQNQSAICAPVSGNREMLESGGIGPLVDNTPRRPLLEDVGFGSMPLNRSYESNSATCSSTILVHTERAENSYAAEKDSSEEPSASTIACEILSVVVPSCQETLATGSANQMSFIDSGQRTTEGFANVKESKIGGLDKDSLDKDSHKMLGTEARSEEALQLDDMGFEIREVIGGKIKRKARSKRSRKGAGVLIERGPSAACPICQMILSGDIGDALFNSKFNEHIDACMGSFGT